MIQRKSILRASVSLILGMVIGSCATGWYLRKQTSRELQEAILQTTYIQTITLVRLSETLETGNVDDARYGLEESLNAKIAFAAAYAYQTTRSGAVARETIGMAARHRAKYPFTANNPCINKMVSIAFQAANWDGHSAPPHQVYWSE